jgi:hypothetical protein
VPKPILCLFENFRHKQLTSLRQVKNAIMPPRRNGHDGMRFLSGAFVRSQLPVEEIVVAEQFAKAPLQDLPATLQSPFETLATFSGLLFEALHALSLGFQPECEEFIEPRSQILLKSSPVCSLSSPGFPCEPARLHFQVRDLAAVFEHGSERTISELAFIEPFPHALRHDPSSANESLDVHLDSISIDSIAVHHAECSRTTQAFQADLPLASVIGTIHMPEHDLAIADYNHDAVTSDSNGVCFLRHRLAGYEEYSGKDERRQNAVHHRYV